MVIILNPNDELKIVKFQNDFIKNLEIDNFLCKFFPLWIELPFLTDNLNVNLSQIAKKISNVDIYDFDNFSANVKIIFANKEYTTKLKIFEKIVSPSCLSADKKARNDKVDFFRNHDENFSRKGETDFPTIQKLESIVKSTFPMKISVFRLGIEHKIFENAFSLKDSVWVKIKNNHK